VPTADSDAPGSDPSVLLVSDDVFMLPRLEDGARAAGLSPLVVDSLEAVEASGDLVPRPVPITEPLEGSDGGFLRAVVDAQPALIVFDLSSTVLPWPRWLQILKTSSATRRVPVLAFGPHVDETALEQARRLGAERVVTRGQMQARVAELMRAEARPIDPAAIRGGCQRPAADQALQGMEALRAGRYFEAHEHLERAVLDDPGPEGSVYRALLLLAVACLHTERGNWRGAQKMLLRLRPWLAPLPAHCRGVDVETLRAAALELQARLDRWREDGEPPVARLAPPQIDVSMDTGA
jgi:predicted metal-dependent hydrolase